MLYEHFEFNSFIYKKKKKMWITNKFLDFYPTQNIRSFNFFNLK